jgi:hypothetical protein
MLVRMSADDCIRNNDFYTAREKYNNANARWKRHWFNTCHIIAKKNPKYLTKYSFHEEKIEIESVDIRYRYNDNEVSHTYLIDLLDKDETVFTKVGKADNVGSRLSDIVRDGYRGYNINEVDIVKVYGMPSPDLAEALESLIKHYIKKNKNVGYYPQDRFTPFDFTEEDFFKFENIRNTILALFE